MVKYIYKVVILMVVFCGALFFFGSRLQSDSYETGEVVEAGSETFPFLTVKSQGIRMNRLYGYSGVLDANIVRESITPLASDKSICIIIGGTDTKIVKMQYEVSDKDTLEVYEKKELNAISQDTEEVNLNFEYGFKTSTEYVLAITATTESGRKIHYYTRLKYYMDNSYLQEKLAFAMKFHEDTFSKSKAEELSRFLEPDGTAANDTLAEVNIKSDSDLVTWSKISPKKISEPVPIVKEYNMETACFQLNYYIKGKTATGKETYRVNEFYRIRYASGNSYLLNYERTMETVFDAGLTSVQKNQIKIGITNDISMDLMNNDNTKQLFFAREGNLYCYDMDKKNNVITKLFSSYSEKAPYEYRENAMPQMRLLKTDEEGNLFFAVAGYVPRGRYEGKVAIILYKYAAQEKEIQELVYLPIDTTEQQLNKDFNNYGYVSGKNVYYFTVAGTVYGYNMESHRLTKLAENVTNSSFQIIPGISKNEAGKTVEYDCFAWSDDLNKGYGEALTVLNLETEEKTILKPENDACYIRLLGVINDKVIYGYVNKSDVVSQSVDEEMAPCYKIVIADEKGVPVKSYQQKNVYVKEVSVKGNVMTLSRVKKQGKKVFRKISEDSILNQTEYKTSAYQLQSRVTDAAQTEWYIGFPSNFTIDEVPKYKIAEEQIVTSARAVHLDEIQVPQYYVYALGKITEAYEKPVLAIQKADEQMGVVVSRTHHVVWERSGSFLMNSIAGIEMQKAQGPVTNLAACVSMVLKANHVAVDAATLAKKNAAVYPMLAQYMKEPMNLSGATLEQVLYFVSNNKYVIAMTGSSTAVVISGYDTKNITVYNPASGKVETIKRTQAEKIFMDNGNSFFSYLN
ncbi:MAG: hypothetical protein ACI4SQ_05590 [Eubacterium sp.]